MKPFTKGALVSALWWVPVGIVLALVLQVAAFSLLGYLMSSGSGPDWLQRMGLREVRYPSIDALPDHGPFEYRWSAHTLDGKRVSMKQFRGKVIFFNHWATWCMPCVMEMPAIDRLRSSVDPEEVVFLILSTEESEIVRDFLEDKDWDLPVYVMGDMIPKRLVDGSLPYTAIVDPQGTIRFEHYGAGDYDTDSAREFLDALAIRTDP